MASNDIKVLHSHYGAKRFRVEANVTVGILPGDGAIRAGTNNSYAQLVLDGMPTQGTDIWLGVTKSTGDNTTALDGVIDVELIGPGAFIQGRAQTAANMNTDALLLPLLNNYVNFDRSAATVAGVLTIDENEASGTGTLSLMIVDGDVVNGTLDCACVNSSLWTGTM